jgi:hypothetical protein
LEKSCEKIQGREAKAFVVVRGRGKFMPSKPGGRFMTVKHFPNFRRATPENREYFYNNTKILALVQASKIPGRPRRNQRLFWRYEFAPPPDIPMLPNFPLPGIFHSFRGKTGDLTAFQKSKLLRNFFFFY